MGTPAWNKGLRGVFKPTREHIQKMREGLKKEGCEDLRRKRISKALKGKPSNTKGKKWKMSEQGKANIREAQIKLRKGKPAWNRGKSNHWCKGEKSNTWAGGVSQNPYPREFNEPLKKMIRARDGYCCQLCGKTQAEEKAELSQQLCVNHIDFNKNNCHPDNLNTLCLRCNVFVNRDRDKWTAYFKERQCQNIAA